MIQADVLPAPESPTSPQKRHHRPPGVPWDVTGDTEAGSKYRRVPGGQVETGWRIARPTLESGALYFLCPFSPISHNQPSPYTYKRVCEQTVSRMVSLALPGGFV